MTFRLQGYYLLCRPFRMAFVYDMDFLLPLSPPELNERSHDPMAATSGDYHAAMV